MITWRGADRASSLLLAYMRGKDHPARYRVIDFLLKHVFQDGVAVESTLGGKMRIRPREFISRRILWEGHYEGESLALAARLLKERAGVFVDAGANHGLYTCTLGVLPGVTCIAIEPDAGNFLELQTNMALNPAVKAKLANVCVARERALLELEDIDPANSGKIRVVVDKAPNGCPRHTVAAVSLQELLTDAAVSQVTLLKVDVEGYELPVLEGLDWNSNLRPEHILIEYSDYVARAGGDQGKESLIRFFEQRGYQGFTIRGEPLGTAECVPESNAWFKDARPR